MRRLLVGKGEMERDNNLGSAAVQELASQLYKWSNKEEQMVFLNGFILHFLCASKLVVPQVSTR